MLFSQLLLQCNALLLVLHREEGGIGLLTLNRENDTDNIYYTGSWCEFIVRNCLQVRTLYSVVDIYLRVLEGCYFGSSKSVYFLLFSSSLLDQFLDVMCKYFFGCVLTMYSSFVQCNLAMSSGEIIIIMPRQRSMYIAPMPLFATLTVSVCELLLKGRAGLSYEPKLVSYLQHRYPTCSGSHTLSLQR